ncbi:dynein heavy chain and region D6 of dynein motor-domain-containing protein [Pelagophyceae sp. CCMP2097]|nr:dynein heavy chain and region D6 of dynein motor-domain-containing protein [Pelagophyceae sp. CCMP2097]
MPTEAKLFDAVDETWRAAVGAIAAQPAALALLDRPGLVDGLAAAARGIDAVRAGLAGYLGAKRVAFPRFYFVSDAELLRIVADAADPRRVQRHLHKLFDGIHALEFETAQDGVLQVVAASDRPGAGAERLDFASADHEAIRAGSGDVERWLGDVNTASRLSLARAVDAALEEATDRRDVSRRRWAATWLAQVVCIVCRVAWARDVEAALRRSAAAAAEATVAAVREPATERARAALSGLVVLDVGHRDAVSALVAKRVSSAADFEWISQLRFYSDGAPGAAGAVEARCVHATLPYAYEYLGGGGARLVATPLGGRCAKALVAALQASAGCAVVGVPGAGATATVADLGHAVATRCVVVHCAPTFGAAAARAMLRGAFESGAWLVLDHGHRLAPATLAAAVAMVADLQGALRCCQKPAADDAREDFAFRPTARAFVTLPNTDAARLGPLAALRGLFRPVALGLPDAAAIAEVTLRSEGAPHAEARRVARCVTEALRAAAEHLPGDYDFGLCCVVATVRAVVHLARVHGAFEGPAAADGAGGAPPLLALAARALADTVEPALAPPDVETFRGAVAAAFAGVAAADAAEPRGDFAAAFHGACLQRSQQPTDRLVAKASQVHDALAVRGVALVGSVFTGKTSTWRNLAAAYALLGAEAPDDALWKSLEARAVVVLPNALTLGDLYGRFIGGDGDWVDGVLARTAAGAPPTGGAWAAADANARGGRTWVVLDGAVDAAWAEHLHTALEASKLQLASRDAVAVGDGVSLLFEAEDLRGVSPGFASRVGIVHFAAGLVGWRNIVDAWKRRYEGALLDALVDWLVEPALAFSRTEAADEAAGGAGDAAVVQAVLRLLEALLGERRRRRQHVECAFVWALLWAVGADCAAAARLRFGVFVRDVLADAHALPAKHAAVHLLLEQRGWRAPEFTGAFSGRLQLPLPLKGAAHDYEYRPRDGEGGAWRPWRDAPLLGPPLDLGGLVTTASSALVVPTELTAQLAALFELTRAGGHALLLHGAVGSGKTMHARDMLARLPRKQFHTAAFGLHATSTAASASAALAQSLVKRRKGVLGPPINKSAVIFVDDVNLPDDGGALGDAAGGVAVELLRDLVEHKAWHASHGDSAQGPQLQQVEETLLIVALCGRAAMKSVSARFARHFFCVRTSDPSDAALTHVFTTLLEAHFASQSFATEVATAAAAVAAATVWSLREVSSELPPAPSRPLCCFDARDAARCVEGVLRCRADDDFDRDALARLWAHEALRTFSDRLHRADDQDWFAQHLQAALLRHFKVDIEALFHRGAAADASQAPRAAAAAVGPRELLMLMFADFQDFRNPADKRAYVEVHDATKLDGAAAAVAPDADGLIDAAAADPPPAAQARLVLFPLAVSHVSRVVRALGMPGGHALLVGPSGSGRRAAARLAARLAGCELHAARLCGSFAAWRADLQAAVVRAGAGELPVCLVVGDARARGARVLADLCDVAHTRSIPGLFAAADREAVETAARACVRRQRGAAAADAMAPDDAHAFLVDRSHARLHLVLTLDPDETGPADDSAGAAVGPPRGDFASMLRRFPGLFSRFTSVDFYGPWPDDALTAVADHHLAATAFTVAAAEGASLACVCRGLHVSVARARGADVFRATPATFVELLRCFDMHLGRLRASLSEERRRLSGALEAVASAERGVATIGDGVAAAEAALAATAVEADAAEAALRAFQAASGLEAADADVAADADALRREEEALASLVADFERALDAARPALAAALRGVEGLPADEISALRLCARVPPTAKPVFEAVCVLAGDKPVKVESATEARRVHDFWPAVQSNVLAGDAAHVAARLRAVDHDALPPKALAKFLGEYAGPGAAHAAVVDGADRLDGFPGAAVARALGAWVRAARDYAAASAAAQPQRDAAVAARRGVDAAAADVAEKRRILADGRNALAALAAARAGARDRGDELREAIAAGGKRLDRAARLVDTLASSGDAERWRSAAADVDRRADAAAGDALVAAGALTHLARSLRANYGILLPSPSLDADGAGLEAALLARHTARWPLLLDPDGVAGRWLRAAAPRAAVVPARAKALVWAAVAAAAPAGLVVIVDNVGRADCLDMAASGLLPRRVQPPAATPGEDSHLAVGAGDFEQMVFCHASFRLYLTTAEAALPMLRCSGGGGERLAVVDFALSDAGVEREVLHAVAAHEQPGTLKRELDLDLASGRHDAALAEAQSALLDRLAHRGADAGLAVLDDGQAFDAALRSVAAARDLRLEHAELRAARGDITAAVNAYAPLAKHASAVYGAAADVARAKPAYACSLEKFVEAVLLPSLRRSTAPGDRGTRLEAQIAARIAEARTQLDADAMVVFGGALLAEDRRLFAVLLTARPRLADGTFSPAAWHFLLTGDAAPPDGAAAARRACAANPAAGWLADVQWDEICRLATIPPFLDLEADFVAAPSKFKRVADANDPLAEPLPRRWEDLKGLDRVCLVRCLRPDLVAAALAAFAGAADPPAFDADALAGASQLEPVVLIAHPRDFAAAAASLADAAAAVQRPVVHVSLAGSDAAATEAAIAHARGSGAWLIVQGAMSLNLEDLYVGLNACAPHEDFRLFVVSAATVALPAALRPRAAVVAYEAPCGLRAAVRAVYDGALRRDADYFAKCSRGGAFRKLFFALSACHALLRARRAYGAAGWPAHYEFEAADVTRAAKVVASLLDDYDGAAAAPFEAIARCVEEGLGGGIVDAVDRRLLASLVARFCHGDVMRPGHALAAAGEPRMPLQDGAAAVWLRAVDGLPALPPLDFLGLGDAAAFEKGGRESADVLLAVLRASPQHRPEAIDDSVDVEARAREVAASLPAALDVAALGGVPADARPPYLRAILVQEVARYNALLRSAKESLRDVSRALKGRQVMTVRVDTVRRDVAVGRVPACWDAYPSTRALAPFLDDLGLRCAFFAAWAKGAQPPVLWLGAFCAPRALLSAMKHHHAAKHGLDLADLELDSRCVQLDGAAPGPHAAFPDDGLYARGLALQSARWDARRQGLVEALPRAPYAPAPVVWFTCMPAADRAGRSTDETFDCPLYRTTARRGKASSDGLDTNFVVFVRLPSHLPTSHWVERGVAMFLGTD